MATIKRLTGARAKAVPRARQAALELGVELRAARCRRRLTQTELARRVGSHASRVSQLERGEGGGAPLELWFAIAAALDRPLRIEFGRDPSEAPRDAGHLDIEELVLRLAKPAGFQGGFEIPTRPSDPSAPRTFGSLTGATAASCSWSAGTPLAIPAPQLGRPTGSWQKCKLWVSPSAPTRAL